MTPPPGEEPARGTRYYRGLSHLAIRRPLGTAAVAAVVLVLGLFAGSRLAVNLLPEVVYPLIQISVNYPGVAPEIMEEQVTRVLERQLASTEDLVRMDSDAREGQANVRLIFDFGVDLDRAPQLGIDIDRARAAALGVNVSDVGNALRDAVTGAVPTRYATGQREYDVRVRLPRDAINDVDTLGAVVVADGENGVVRLSDVARLQFEDGPVRIQRENQSRIQRVVGAFNTSERDVSATVAEAQEVVAALDLGDDLRPIFGGAFESIQETRAESRVVIALAVFLVLAVLIVQYERLSNPLVIMLTAPYALVGVAGVLWLTATPLSAPVLLGVILLVGIVVNNAILLVEYIERGLRRGLELTAAVVEAGRIRLRPILMTVLTTLSGMLPLALGAGEGADLMRPLALTVVGGLAVSTLLTLVLAPCLFVLVRGMAGRVNAALFGPGEARAAV